jgi:AAA+ superfamily predicted ATPase
VPPQDPGTGPQTNAQRLSAALRSSAPCVSIVTDEEAYALGLIRDAAMELRRPLLQWNAVRGLHDGLVAPSTPVPGTENPAAALFSLSKTTDGSVILMQDLAGHLQDERTLRAARDLVNAIECAAGALGPLVLLDYRDALPPVLRSAARRVDLAFPDEAEIEQIVVTTIRHVNRERPIDVEITKRGLASIVKNLRGLTRRQVEQAITEAVWDDRRFNAGDLDTILARKRQLVQSDGLLEFVRAPTDMSQIGGLGKLKDWLAKREEALSDEALKFGLEPPRGLLLLGVQGAGKSLCTKAIATAWKRPLMRLDPGVLYDRYIGESERRLRDALRQAELMAPVVLWIDEIEKAFAGAASRSIDGGLSQRMFGTLLTWMQEHREPVFLAATANDIEALPPELLRKGRFDEIFFVDLPGDDAREQIFAIHLKKRARDPKGFDCKALAAASRGYSGAEIEQAVISGLHEAFCSGLGLTTDMVLKGLRGSPPLSVTMAERINALREWAVGRCVPAE